MELNPASEFLLHADSETVRLQKGLACGYDAHVDRHACRREIQFALVAARLGRSLSVYELGEKFVGDFEAPRTKVMNRDRLDPHLSPASRKDILQAAPRRAFGGQDVEKRTEWE